jgi:tRNA A37 threonylcarbamoyladenosine synthetase subunit TsaC/SUA5/YrdC
VACARPGSALKTWKADVDFVVSNGLRAERLSTVVDMTEGEPSLLRAGDGSFATVVEHYPQIAGEPE